MAAAPPEAPPEAGGGLAAAAAAAEGGTAEQAAAFRRLYPAEYYARFLAEGVRPDGRPPGRPRPLSIGLGSITTADASALLKARCVLCPAGAPAASWPCTIGHAQQTGSAAAARSKPGPQLRAGVALSVTHSRPLQPPPHAVFS